MFYTWSGVILTYLQLFKGPKNYIADFVGFKAVYFGRKFWKKCPKRGGEGGVIANPKKIIANLRILTNFLEKAQCNFHLDFSKKTSIFGEKDVPKETKKLTSFGRIVSFSLVSFSSRYG